MTDIEDKVKDAICHVLGIERSELKADTSFEHDLDIDSVDAIDLVMEIEDEFDISVSDRDMQYLKTVGDVVRYVEEST